MRVVCDNCGATYRIPEAKLQRDVNKATCRKCKNPIIITKSGGMAVGGGAGDATDPDAVTQISQIDEVRGGEAAVEPQVPPSQVVTPPFGLQSSQPLSAEEENIPPTVAESIPPDQTIPRLEPREATKELSGERRARQSPPPPPLPELPPPMMLPDGATPNRVGLYDPVGDQSVVMMANFAAILGVLMLILSEQQWQTYGGSFLALWGALTSLLVVITSNRGRRHAHVVTSLFAGLVLAGGSAWGFYWNSHREMPALDGPRVVSRTNVDEEEEEEEPEVAEEEDSAAEDALALADEPAEDPAGEDVPAVPASQSTPASSATPVSSSSGTSSSSSSRTSAGSGSGSSGSTGTGSVYPRSSGSSETSTRSSSSGSSSSSASSGSSRSSSSSASSGSSGSSSSSASSGSGGVPLTVMDTMLRSNRGVKTCFVEYTNRTGDRPSGRITVRIRIDTDGVPIDARIDSGSYRGTSLDSCLGSAIREITFPPFEGEAKTYRYPFLL